MQNASSERQFENNPRDAADAAAAESAHCPARYVVGYVAGGGTDVGHAWQVAGHNHLIINA